MGEQRRFARINLDGRACLDTDGRKHPVDLADLSLQGAMVRGAAREARIDQACEFTLELDDSDLVFRIQARITHVQADRVGIEFTQLDLETMQHIRRMLELNTGRDDLILNKTGQPYEPPEQ